jgi:hypothetical protein
MMKKIVAIISKSHQVGESLKRQIECLELVKLNMDVKNLKSTEKEQK